MVVDRSDCSPSSPKKNELDIAVSPPAFINLQEYELYKYISYDILQYKNSQNANQIVKPLLFKPTR